MSAPSLPTTPDAGDPGHGPRVAAAWVLLAADGTLRPEPRPGTRPPGGIAGSLAVILVFASVAGAVMGTYGGVGPDRLEQIAYSTIKVPILLLGTFVLCLPGFVTANVLLGVGADLRDALRAILRTQAAIAVLHAAFMPAVAFWYVFERQHAAAVSVNALALGAASLSAQLVLRRAYRPLVARDSAHRSLMWLWLVLYGFVGVQLAWVLRPYIGNPGLETAFFRENSWSNAYLALADKMLQALGLR